MWDVKSVTVKETRTECMVVNFQQSITGVKKFLPITMAMPELIISCIQIDMVELPSWQAQLSGKKTWTLTPPPECEHVCQPFNVTVNRGDISKSAPNFFIV